MLFLETTLAGFWDTLVEMAPYLLFGFLVAGILSVLIPASLIERHLGGRGVLPSLKAAAFGVPLPLCSCGVIPVGASLRRHGATRGATTAFLISTPQTGVDGILVTLSLLGPIFAVFRPFAAFLAGVFGGSIADALEGDDEREERLPAQCEDACCTAEGGRSRVGAALRYGFLTLPEDIGRSLLVGLVLAGLITALVPQDLATKVGAGFVGMLVMMALGLPIYVCATASVPIAAALIAKGVSPGAAFVFLMTGPATNAATLTTVWKVMGRRTAIVYLSSVAVSALALGALLNVIYVQTGAEPAPHAHGLIPHAVKVACAVLLLLVLANAILRRGRGGEQAEPETANEAEAITLSIDGMTCSHCAASVTRALEEAEGVASANVDLDTGRATVTGEGLDRARLRSAVESLGYEVSDAAPGPPS
ncbi:MAG: permease [Planctomycetota bacterium]